MSTLKKYTPALIFCCIFCILYFYFLPWRTQVAYGDDLMMYRIHEETPKFSDQIWAFLQFEKYRPTHDILVNIVMNIFKTNVHAYYVLNIVMLSGVALIFALIVNYLLDSYFIAFLFAVALGSSHFFFFNIAQLLEGGVLESHALIYFLCSVYFILKSMVPAANANVPPKEYKNLLWGLLFANLCVFTHERYIVLLPLILAIAILFPFKTLSTRQRVMTGLLSIAVVALNVVVKKVFLNIPFFKGTGGTNIEFSASQMFSFLVEGILSIVQINTGPEYLTGLQFKDLPAGAAAPALLIAVAAFACICIFAARGIIYGLRSLASKILEESAVKRYSKEPWIPAVFFLSGAFLLCLVPAVSTIRLEQRWLTASYSVFLILMIMVIANIQWKNIAIRQASLIVLALAIAWVNYSYLYAGGTNIYMYSAEATARKFKTAEDKNIIHPSTKKLYIFEDHRDANQENVVTWSLMGGYIFKFYRAEGKELIFVDSTYTKTDTAWVGSFSSFDPKTSQIIYLSNELKDITSEFLKDSLRTFEQKGGQ